MAEQDRRPRFYEGQYIGSDDLDAVVGHARVQHGRHLLGGHTPGIAVGLELIERPIPGNRREVILQAGYAWDGFGRPIVVLSPYRLPTSAFASIPVDPALDNPGGTGRLVDVWLQYDEQRGRGPAPGFEDCDLENQFSRVRETFRVVIGPQTPASERDAVNVAGAAVDPVTNGLTPATTPPRRLHDASVPHQLFPEDEPPYRRWLVFVGAVRWIVPVAGQGFFIDRTIPPLPRPVDEQTRARRRYVGVVAEQVNAADRALVLRDRFADPRAPGRYLSRLDLDPLAQVQEDLVWVEGGLRVVGGNARLAGGQLLFRNLVGLDEGTPIYLQRAGDGALGPGNRELRLTIGPQAGQLDNRFVVGPQLGAGDTRPVLTVQSDGKVGVNTRTPSAAQLEVVADGGAAGLMQLTIPGAPANAAFVVTSGGNVGIGMGTSAPQAKLDIRKVEVNVGGNALGTNKWLQIGNDRPDGDDGKVWIQYGAQSAPLLVMSDFDNPPRIQFQQVGAQAENNPAHSSWIGQATGNSNALAIMGDATAPTRVGVNVAAPTEALDVDGRMRYLPPGAPYNLFAAGASQSLIIVIGQVSSSGAKASGDRFTSTRLGMGTYRITFTPALPAAPIVTLTPITPVGLDTLLSLRNVTANSFEVIGADVEHVTGNQDIGLEEDSAFMFMAVCAV